MSFYFYDLETTGLDAFRDRIMQFGGLKVDDDLKPLGELEEFYVKLSEDILPHPQAIVAHKILPQTANLEGLSEYQFLNWLESEVYSAETVYSGYNILDFDNQFMRWLHWRNFAPAAPMSASGASLDIYQLARLAADLRPAGIKWPEHASKRRPNLTLTALTAANDIKHQGAHRAGADVEATLELARKFKQAQPKLFAHCLQLLRPAFVKEIISSNNGVFLYNNFSNLASGAGTTLATILAEHPSRSDCFIVYDLRRAPHEWQKLSTYELSLRLKKIGRQDQWMTPFSILDINRAPPVAPLSVLDAASVARLGIDKSVIAKNRQALKQSGLAKKIADAYLKLASEAVVSDAALFFFEAPLARSKISENDQQKRQQVRAAKFDQIANLDLQFEDPRLKQLQLLYQARNFPKTLKVEQLLSWEQYKSQLFFSSKPSGQDVFRKQLRQSLMRFKDDAETLNILEELQLYIENIMPEPLSH